METTKPLTFKDLEKLALYKFKKPMVKPPTKKPFELLMNLFGWYRQTEVLVISESALGFKQTMEPLPMSRPKAEGE